MQTIPYNGDACLVSKCLKDCGTHDQLSVFVLLRL